MAPSQGLSTTIKNKEERNECSCRTFTQCGPDDTLWWENNFLLIHPVWGSSRKLYWLILRKIYLLYFYLFFLSLLKSIGQLHFISQYYMPSDKNSSKKDGYSTWVFLSPRKKMLIFHPFWFSVLEQITITMGWDTMMGSTWVT